jgi:protein-serine/threonine kinase
VKPENILIDAEGHIRLTDFGLSKSGLRGDQGATLKTESVLGTGPYLAPEIINTSPENGYGFSADWFSAGVVLYEMLSGFNPFKKGTTAFEQMNEILKAELPM